MSETDAEIIQHVRRMDTPTDADPRRRYTQAQLEMAIRLARRGAEMQWRPMKLQAETIAEQAAEIERLRAALREIAGLDDEPKCCGRGIGGYTSPPECCGDPERGIDRAQAIARAALEERT